MNGQKIAINRPLVGVLALLSLAGAVVLWLIGLEQHDAQLWIAGLVRVGLVLAAFWLALPSDGREAAWANVSPVTLLGILLAVFAVARYPRAVLPVLAVIAVIGYFLRPRPKKRPGTRVKDGP